MKKTWILVCTLLFLSVAGFADSPSPGPVPDEVLAAILGEPLAGSSCATQAGAAGEVLLVTAVPGQKATCTVDCGNGTSVSCTSNTTCTAVQRNCTTALETGRVTCNGVTTSCTPGCCTGMGIIGNACCRCNVTGNCTDCCRCEGGTLSQCATACS